MVLRGAKTRLGWISRDRTGSRCVLRVLSLLTRTRQDGAEKQKTREWEHAVNYEL